MNWIYCDGKYGRLGPVMSLAWLIPAFSVAAFLLLACIGKRLPKKAALVSLAAVAAGCGLAIYGYIDLRGGVEEVNVGPGPFSVNFLEAGDMSLQLSMVIDSLSITMLLVVTFLSFVIQLYSIGYMRGDPRIHWFFAVVSLFTAAMLGLVLANNLIILYVSWELVGLCSYLLIGYWWERPTAREAAKKAFVTTRIGDVGLLIGILVLFKATGSFEIDEIFSQLRAGTIPAQSVSLAAILMFLGAMGKSGQFPLHVWLPDAMEGPTPVSALIHAATMVTAGVYLVARMFPLFVASDSALLVVLTIGTITAILAALLALVETDMKRVLAYSTISQLGYMMFALGSGSVTAAMLHLVGHAFFKALLFLGAGAIMHATHGIVDIDRLGGLRRRMPITTWTFVIGALSLAGFPLLSGFWSKDLILNAAFAGGHWATFLVGVLTAALTGFYMFRVIFKAFFGEPRSQEARTARKAEPIVAIPLVILAFFAVTFGWVGSPLTGDPFGHFVFASSQSTGHDESILVIILSSTAAVLGLAAAYSVYQRGRPKATSIRSVASRLDRFLAERAYIDSLYQWLIDNVSLGLAVLVAVFDRRIVNDIGVDEVGNSIHRSGQRLRQSITGYVYNYGVVMVLGVITLALGLLVTR
jgi:NADH-quinone oxidoreductase subunit L